MRCSMDLSQLSGLVLVVVGAVLFVTTVQLYSFWASEAVLAAAARKFDETVESFKRTVPYLFVRRRKAA